eukprot:CAMPEP_0119311778 /NCGR_PEP_ID=MMETSP1333-20130426/23837_1 /TAXON_ID=418940 /ORGANISM="Scyphosphaera apsteinii, Strain RCC1455" /LENGTH=59 /DNA_ID=CAMNT_0007316249 /DNA_START=1 /DNA_END=180 /DNA_ORIENTATION=-
MRYEHRGAWVAGHLVGGFSSGAKQRVIPAPLHPPVVPERTDRLASPKLVDVIRVKQHLA